MSLPYSALPFRFFTSLTPHHTVTRFSEGCEGATFHRDTCYMERIYRISLRMRSSTDRRGQVTSFNRLLKGDLKGKVF